MKVGDLVVWTGYNRSDLYERIGIVISHHPKTMNYRTPTQWLVHFGHKTLWVSGASMEVLNECR